MPVEALDLLDEVLVVRDRDVLDVGCGEGWLARRFAAAGARAVGVDPQAIAVERAREATPAGDAAQFFEGGAQALPFAAASFDCIVFSNSLHHVPEEHLDAALAEAARVTRPGGTIYVQEPLAAGNFFELMLPIDDETHVRTAAQAAVARALGGPLVELARHDAVITVRLADFAAMRRQMVGVDPARGAVIDAQEADLRAAFERLGTPVSEGLQFEQPVRVFVLSPRAAATDPAGGAEHA